MNPFDLRGPQFLTLFSFLIALASVLALLLRYQLRTPGGEPPDGALEDPYQLAILDGGPNRAAEAAIASLVHRGVLRANRGTRRIELTGPRPNNVHPAEDAVYLAFPEDRQTVRPEDLRAAVAREIEPLADGLAQRNLIPSRARALSIQFGSTLPLLLLLAIGAKKCAIGLSRDRPIGYLVLLMLLVTLVAGAFVVIPVRNTRRGAAYLSLLRRRNAALRTACARPSAMLSPNDLATAVALFGLDTITSGPLASLAEVLRPPPKTSSSDSSSCSSYSSNSCSSSSCGSSGCGGGGGCGGCGS